MTRIAVIVGSTRPGRRSEPVARWVHEIALGHPAVQAGTATVEIVDLADHALPLLDEPTPPIFGKYEHDHTKRWSATIASFDAFVFVSPEYNHSMPAALKNAIDFLFAEWNDKAAGFVTYGTQGGIRAAEHLRQVLAEMKVATVRTQVALSLFNDFEITDPALPGTVKAGDRQASTLHRLLDELLAWSGAFETLRAESAAADA